MNQLECPSPETWAERRKWFEELFDVDRRGGGYIMGEHALGLLVDLQAVFCSGAWAATIIVSATVIDAHIREAELPPGFGGGLKAAFEAVSKPEYEWIRLRRNEFVHFDSRRGPIITVEIQWDHGEALERDARRALELVADALFAQPWT